MTEYRQIKYDVEFKWLTGTDIDLDPITQGMNAMARDGWRVANTYTIEKVKGGTKFVIVVYARDTAAGG